MSLTIFHNPDCGTSRNTLMLLRTAGYNPEIVEYLRDPPTPEKIVDLAARAGLTVRQLLRRRGTPFAAMGLDDPGISEDALAKIAHGAPILLNRPIVDDGKVAGLCRPSDLVFDVVAPPTARLCKEDGAPVLRDVPVGSGQLDDLKAALVEAGLPADDITEDGRRFFAYATLDGELVGYGGFELYASTALVRSLVVLPRFRKTGIGRNMALILFRRVFDLGGSELYLLTNSARVFFEKLGFVAVNRSSAPNAIVSTSQFTGLCPASAILLYRRNEP